MLVLVLPRLSLMHCPQHLFACEDRDAILRKVNDSAAKFCGLGLRCAGRPMRVWVCAVTALALSSGVASLRCV